ncbi:Dihydrofolate reductase [Chitinophaga rupis]|uniref:Dihydrofolate reductase n=1 Tax=Chitinophaga rupis TaxID=573321 RepID=A0A1H8AZH9_9BACT|nr:dihydrofolate reductase family protein [Chitinophaga rupis]SEM75903.1 Dihydrofolate reductase [Chitinophaga rupis]
MRKLILKVSMSVDGFMAGPNGEMDWFFKSRSEEGAAWLADTLWQAGLHIMGSRTFYTMASHWPFAKDAVAEPMNAIPKVVFTSKDKLDLQAKGLNAQALKDANASPDAHTWAEAQIANGDLAEEIKKLKQQQGKDILAQGGASFVQSLVATGLIDEYRLVIHPVVLGTGLPVFSKLPKPSDLQLVEHIAFKAGTVVHVYRALGN